MPPMIRLFDKRTYGYAAVGLDSSPTILKAALKAVGRADLTGRWIPERGSPDSREMKQLATLISASLIAAETTASHVRIRERSDKQFLENRSAIQTELPRLDEAKSAFSRPGTVSSAVTSDNGPLDGLV